MFDLDPGKLLIVAVVALLVLGPDKLPDAARRVGDTWRSFNEFRHRMETQVRSTVPDLPSTGELARLARSPSALLNHLSDLGADGDGVELAPAPEPDVGPAIGEWIAPATALGAPALASTREAPAPIFAVVPGDAGLN